MVAGLAPIATIDRWSDFEPNPSTDDLACGLSKIAQFNPELVVGIGGGSVLDMAKLVRAFAGTTDLMADLHSYKAGDFSRLPSDQPILCCYQRPLAPEARLRISLSSMLDPRSTRWPLHRCEPTTSFSTLSFR